MAAGDMIFYLVLIWLVSCFWTAGGLGACAGTLGCGILSEEVEWWTRSTSVTDSVIIFEESFDLGIDILGDDSGTLNSYFEGFLERIGGLIGLQASFTLRSN